MAGDVSRTGGPRRSRRAVLMALDCRVAHCSKRKPRRCRAAWPRGARDRRGHGRPQPPRQGVARSRRSEEHTSELQSQSNIVCRLLLEKKKKMLRDFIGIRVNRAKKSGMVNITSSVNSRERSGINTILHELTPLFTINVTIMYKKRKNVYSRCNSKAMTQGRKTESSNGFHLE